MKRHEIRELFKLGGKGSGNFGHAGRPGKRGGSLPHSAAMSLRTGKDAAQRQAIASGKVTSEELKRQEAEAAKRKKLERFVNSDRVSRQTLRGRQEPTEKQKEKLVEYLMQHPDAVTRAVESILLYDSKSWYAMLQRDGYDRFTNGLFYPKRRSMRMPQSLKDVVFHHEMGHALWQVAKKPQRLGWLKSYRTNKNFDRHTRYAKTDSEEGFCEAYSAYVKSGGVARYPKIARTFSAIEGMIPDF